VEELLDNPVYHALTTRDAHLAKGAGAVRYFDEQVSPFAGFPSGYEKGFEELHEQLPAGYRILFATTKEIAHPKGWELKAEVKGLQFVYNNTIEAIVPTTVLTRLEKEHIPQMVELTRLTKPGPFASGTIAFGNYFGIFDGDKLVAMTGQRLHVAHYTEISAVCTHPDYLGKGYATQLLQHQLNLVTSDNQIPFLHVRDDNKRAIGVYEKLGFALRGPMIFYFMTRSDEEQNRL
jgi:GNAT superfamily N-acetyltransferase